VALLPRLEFLRRRQTDLPCFEVGDVAVEPRLGVGEIGHHDLEGIPMCYEDDEGICVLAVKVLNQLADPSVTIIAGLYILD